MFTRPTRGRRVAHARRRFFASLLATFFILNQVAFIVAPVAQAQRGVTQRGVMQPAPTGAPETTLSIQAEGDEPEPRDTGTGSVSLTTLGSPVTENFNTLSNTAGSTTNTTLPTGWYLTETGGGARDNEQYAVDTGGSNTGDTYSYGAAGSTDRAFGGLQSGTLIPVIGARFTNNTGATITSLDIAYTGEQWRISNTAAARDDRMDFQISTNATDLSTGTYTDVNALDFTNPVKTAAAAGALDGNNAANRTAISSTITSLNIPNGASFFIRWTDFNASGADDGLAIDDFSITPQGGAVQPSLSINDVSQDEGDSSTTAFTFSVNLSAPAGPGGVTFDIATADGTATVADNDYQSNSLTGQTIPQGSSGPYQFTVNVVGDTKPEPNETFFVNVTNVSGATVTDGQGQGTIVNDDGVVITPIHEIQGSGDTSPLAGQTGITTEGIVTLLKTGSNAGNGAASGFFIQTPDGAADSDPNTSQGLFIFTSSVPAVALGDAVRVTGSVVEFNGLTEMTSVTNVSVTSTGNPLPTAVTLTNADLPPTANFNQPQLEKYEGMRVTASSFTTVTPNDNFFDVYAVITGTPRPMREPGIEINKPVPPDPTSGVPDPNVPRFDLNPERIKIDNNGRAGAANQPYTSNVVLTNVAGPLDYAFNEYRLIPQADPTASANMSAVAVPAPASSEFTVASYNIENFANNATQRQKAALTIRTVLHLPDIIGLAEIANLASLEALATQVNNDTVAAGGANPMYEARLIPAPSGGSQHLGFLVKTSRVRIDQVTQERADETYTNPNNGQQEVLNDRPPLVLRATVEPMGANLPVIVVVNHLRSFICIDAETAGASGCSASQADGPRVRAKRKAQGESLAGLLQELQSNNPSTPVISVGDYNAFQFNDGYTDPVATIKGNPTPDDQVVVDQSPDLVNPDFFNLTDELPVEQRYTFIFNGTPQALDHALVNTVAHARRTRYAIARVNADFPEVPAAAFASNASRPERNSDHDIPVAYFTTAQATATAGQLIISEFRLHGLNGANDEFVEIYNNTDSALTVNALDGSAGFALAASDGVTRFTIPNGTIIPARGHYLGVNSAGYSLASYPAGNGTTATGDATYTTDIPTNAGLALFSTSNAANFTLANRLDAVGSVSEANTLYKEGTGYPNINGAFNVNYSLYRDMFTGLPKDTNNNEADFILVDTNGTNMCASTITFRCQRLGAPGPENLSSPIMRTSLMPTSLIAPCVAATAAPNRVRDTTEDSGNNSTLGTLDIRRRFTNVTGSNVTRLRFRIVDITTFPVPSGTADLRARTSTDVIVSNPCTGTIQTVRGTTLEEANSPADQPNGGAYNSTLSAGVVTLATPLAHGASIDVRFLLGVQQTGQFRFFVIVEVLP